MRAEDALKYLATPALLPPGERRGHSEREVLLVRLSDLTAEAPPLTNSQARLLVSVFGRYPAVDESGRAL